MLQESEILMQDSFQNDFESLTNGIQRIIDLGGEALSEAEEMTEIVAQLDPNSEEYAITVQDIRDAQARAGDAFKQAEDLIAAANELLPNKQ